MKFSMMIKSMLFISFSYFSYAQNPEKQLNKCVADSQTQGAMISCYYRYAKKAKDQMKDLVFKIKKLYRKDKAFLEKFEKSQRVWERSLTANLEMMFPEKDKRAAYGATFSMCSNKFTEGLIRDRIRFLNKWMEGTTSGEMCKGSIRNFEDYMK